MLKRIVFDVDDTLIPWSLKYFKGFRKYAKDNGINLGIYKFYKLLKSIDKYEYEADCLKKESILSYMEGVAKMKFPDNAVDLLIEWLSNCVIGKAGDDVVETLKYLSEKYELVILSNSFEEVQTRRLEKYGILKFFKQVYGGEIAMKPKNEAYLRALGNCKPSECMIVGDNFNFDIVEPSKLGIKPIYVSKKKNKEYITIKSVAELKDLL